MTEVARLSPRPAQRLLPIALVSCGFAIALILGLAAGHPTAATLGPAVVVAVLTSVTIALARPFAAYLVVAASAVMLVAVVLPGGKGLNLFDLLMLPLVVAVVLGSAREQAAVSDATEIGERHEAIRRARRRLSRAVVIYFAWAVLSVVPMFLDGRAANGIASLLALVRAVQGLLLFPLGLWLLRSERRIRHTVAAMFTATVFLLVVNIPYKLFLDVKRAGMSWLVNQPEWPIADPNEAAAAMLIILALLIALRSVRPHGGHVILACAALVMLVMTYSRSGLLALLTFGALLVPRARWRPVLVVVVLLAVILPLIPQEYWDRISRTVRMQRGTSEAFTSMMRFITWKTAINVFLHHPFFGVGYLGLAAVSPAYNDMRLRVGAESYGLEIAADLGIVGLIALGIVIARLFQLGRAVRRATAPGTMGHEMAALHAPLLIGLLAANLTGSNFIGMVGLGQLALWCAIMTRAGHESAKIGAAPTRGDAEAEAT